MPLPRQWWYINANESVGPVDEAQLAQLVQCGTVKSDTLVWCEGMPAWRAFGESAALMQPKRPRVSARATWPGRAIRGAPLYCSEHPGKLAELKMRATDTQILVMDAVVIGFEYLEKFRRGRETDSLETRRALDSLPVLFSEVYRGCPHCGNGNFVCCNGCQAYNCSPIGASSFHCQSCGASGSIGNDGIRMDVSRQSGDSRHEG